MKNWSEDEIKCPISYTLNLLGGRWKWLIIYKIHTENIIRYGELKRKLPSISHKMLSSYLKDLQAEELVFRKEYPSMPPKVEYSLTLKGESLLPILELMSEWGNENLK
ncbi:MAG: winged helix-turn-helix transcriptional regulator [Clostridium sp.]